MQRPAVLLAALLLVSHPSARAGLQGGTAVVDITPETLPVIVNGSFLTRSANSVKTPLKARSLVLSDGVERVAIVVADSCMMPRTLLDEAKKIASRKTGIPADRVTIAATHTHSAGSCMGALGTDADPDYVPFLREKLVEAVVAAAESLQPIKAGWAKADAGEFTAVRRWIRRPDRIDLDPFGNRTVRANMHAARNWDDVTGPTGPEDPDLSMIGFRTADGRPFAVLANFSMHYFGDKALSADYFGLFCDGFQSRVATDGTPFVALLSHGCSGDIWRKDYEKPPGERGEKQTIDEYADALLDLATAAFDTIAYEDDSDLAMAEQRMMLNYRVPDKQRLEWARRIVAAMGERPPKDKTEVYAREQVILHERQSTEVVLQALRIGNTAIATTPTETYALTGLKIKLQSPLPGTMVLDLTNGGDGYIPPPEQHHLGGYNTWAARTAGLEIQAEPKMTETALQLLEEVAGKPRRPYSQPHGKAARTVLTAKPAAYWRLGDFEGSRAVDASGHDRDGTYEPGVVFFLPGPRSDAFCGKADTNRAAHFAGGRLRVRVPNIGNRYSLSLWFWNGLADGARSGPSWLFSRGRPDGRGPHGDHLGLDGAGPKEGLLVFQRGIAGSHTGHDVVPRWTWNHAALVRDGRTFRVYLNGRLQHESTTDDTVPPGFDHFFFGGRCDNTHNWEGRLDEIALFDRPLTSREITTLALSQP